jgi:D-alanine-D-alanine ligase-like ATP-grasp enzyme/tRNA1(Val) A37 N6-methylase TrmN6
MRIGIIHTSKSPCRCAESIAGGLKALGHDFLVVDSEEIFFRVDDLLQCDLVIDHTDTFMEKGYLRFAVRQFLEERSIPVVGSAPAACFAADDKWRVKGSLASSGIPVPQGVLVTSEVPDFPPWLSPPFVVKPTFEHMNRGLTLLSSIDEVSPLCTELLNRWRQPLILESYIRGRDIAVSLVDTAEGPMVLPPVEWMTGENSDTLELEILQFTEKPPGYWGQPDPELSRQTLHEVEGLARRAFRVLGLRDYARFDIRLSNAGTPFFLEANVTPSLQHDEAFALSARIAGMNYESLVAVILDTVRSRYGGSGKAGPQHISFQINSEEIQLVVPPGIHLPSQASIDLAGLLDIVPGETVLDLGSGSGILAVAAAKKGARHVVATDLDRRSLETTLHNARLNGVADRVDLRWGSWYEALRDETGRDMAVQTFDIITGTPPQTPGRRFFGPRYGGPQGTLHLSSVIRGAAQFLRPETGRIWLHLISLVNIREILNILNRTFRDIRIIRETERVFSPDEYERMDEGLFDYLSSLRAAKLSSFEEAGGGTYRFRNLFIRASKPLLP